MTAVKDYRITIRLSPEMGAWIEEQAALHELEAAAFVRMKLAQARNAAPCRADPPANHVPYQGDPLKGYANGQPQFDAAKPAPPPLTVFQPGEFQPEGPQYQPGAEPIEPNPPTMPGHEPEGAYVDEPAQPPPVDVNAIVYQTLAEADAKGLTQPRQQDEDDEDDDHIPGLPRTVTPRGNWQEGGFRKTKEWANR